MPADKIGWLGGGSEIYAQLLPFCTHLYLTRVKMNPPGDTFFPAFENQFSRDQIIHENDDFIVERWLINGGKSAPAEKWPFE